MEVKPGCLCWIVNGTGDLIEGNENRPVEAVRRLTALESYPVTEPAWLIRSGDQLNTVGGHHTDAWCVQRNLRPFTDPDADIDTETDHELPAVLSESGTV